MRCCPYCKRMVRPLTPTSWGVFVILLILGVVPGILYLLCAAMFGRSQCPICRGKHFLKAPPEAYPHLIDVRPVPEPVRIVSEADAPRMAYRARPDTGRTNRER